MFHALLFGLLTAAIVSRIVRRRFLRHAFAGGCGGPGFGYYPHMHRHFHGGYPGGPWGRGPGAFRGAPPWGGFVFRGWHGPMGWEGDYGADEAVPPVDPARLDRALKEIELSDRQRQEIDESLTRLRESVGGELGSWRPLPEALLLVSAAEFDRSRAEAVAGHVSGALRKEIVDGLEHFHNVLTAEQREKLARIARS